MIAIVTFGYSALSALTDYQYPVPGPLAQAITLRAFWRFAKSAIRVPYSSRDGFVRNRLICERRDFSSSVRFFALLDIRVRTRLAGR